MSLELAYSLAGHDKGKLYVVVGKDNGQVLLADGELKSVEKPKRKNAKHIQIVKNVPSSLAEFAGQGALTDLKVKRIIKLYRKNDDTEHQQERISD